MFRLLFTLCLCAPIFAFDIKDILEDENFMAIRDKCLKKVNLKPEDLNFNKDAPAEISEEILCLSKCIQEEQGLLDENGKLDMEKLKAIKTFEIFSEDQKNEVFDCYAEVPEIKECKDVQHEVACFSKVLMKNQ